MIKKMRKLIGLLAILSLIAVSCATAKPKSEKITPENFLDLVPAVEGSVSQPVGFIWAADSQSLMVLTGGGVTHLDAGTLEKTKLSEFTFLVSISQVSPDGKLLAVSLDDRSISLLDLDSQEEKTTIDPGYFLNNFSFSPDGKTLLTASYDDLMVELWDAESGSKIKSLAGFETAAPVYHASFAQNSRHVIWNSRSRVQLTDSESGQTGMSFDHEDWVTSFSLSSDGKYLATTAAATVQGHFIPTVLIWDTDTGETRMLMNSEEPYDGLAFCPDTHLVAVLEEKIITIIDLDQFNKPAELFMPGSPIASMAFSPDGTSLAAFNRDGEFIIWRVPGD